MIQMTDKEFENFCRVMQENYGIDLKKKRVLIEYRMIAEVKKRGMHSFQEFLDAMVKDESKELQYTMINQLTTNYTYFCREMAHYHYIETDVLPNLDKDLNELRILVAGCSSGQECYTLLMMLEEYRLLHVLPSIAMVGCDINNAVLQEARNATYPIRALKEIPESWQKRYLHMDENNENFTISPKLQAQVSFQFHNVLEPFHTVKYQMIMCRNVMIYFDEAARRQTVRNLCKNLAVHGYLVLGHAEVLMEIPQDMEYCWHSIYRKV